MQRIQWMTIFAFVFVFISSMYNNLYLIFLQWITIRNMHWQVQFTDMYNCTNAVIIAQVLIVCNALAIAMFRTKKTSSMASSIPAFGFLSQETMYVLYIMYNWITVHGQSQRVAKKSQLHLLCKERIVHRGPLIGMHWSAMSYLRFQCFAWNRLLAWLRPSL